MHDSVALVFLHMGSCKIMLDVCFFKMLLVLVFVLVLALVLVLVRLPVLVM